MASRLLNIIESVKNNAGEEIYEKVISSYGSVEDKLTPTKQSKLVKGILNELESNCDQDMIAKIMKPCGHKCISNGKIAKAKEIYKKSESLEHFLELLNEQHIGGGLLYVKDGKIIAIYSECYCGLPKYVKGMPASLCNCSVGWLERLFSLVFEKELKVKKIHTVLEGASQCLFEIDM
jgi:predicted hydrocarbon binding protein